MCMLPFAGKTAVRSKHNTSREMFVGNMVSVTAKLISQDVGTLFVESLIQHIPGM